jgi:hypothetical protein
MANGSMRYTTVSGKSFTWPNNPTTCILSNEKRVIKHQFPDIDGAELEELGMEPTTVSGSGVLFGPNAYSDWVQLNKMFMDKGLGLLWHPNWGSFTRMRFTKLNAKQEPLPDYVEYDYEFIESREINLMSRIVESGWLNVNGNWYYYKGFKPVTNNWAQDKKGLWYYLGADGAMVTNQWVAWKGKWYFLKADGVMAANQWVLWKNKWYFLKTNGMMAANEWITWKGVKYYLGPDGVWDEKADKSKVTSSNSTTTTANPSTGSNSSVRYYTTVKGDTLGSIAKKYYGDASKWRKIADANKNIIKNPNIISVGWKLVIPY